MGDTETLTLSRDSFLEPLGAGELSGRLRTPAERDALYALAVEYFASHEAIVGDAPESGRTELAWKVPGTAITVRVKELMLRDLPGLLAIAAFLLELGASPEALGLPTVAAVATKFRHLRTESGERSVVEVLADAHPPTVEQILLGLYGKPCRHPDAGCRFMREGGRCGIERQEVAEVVEWLVGQGVLRQLTPVAPVEYGVAI